ncbi:MAG: helix-turn-helix transcriptional regulator [Eubacteriales bacterium]|nr:helix-turn-helix transcriptional regulator [Eubacteriales bacterium]
MTTADIPERIKQLMVQKDWSRYELMKQSGVAKTTLYKTIAGESVPGVDILQMICDGFGISVKDFFSPEKEFEPHVEYTTQERELIEIQRTLNSEQRASVLGYARAIADMSKK